jgi:hypothetical protein
MEATEASEAAATRMYKYAECLFCCGQRYAFSFVLNELQNY